ncbi:MAG: hypothetical protein VYA84_03490 [Planctomycetota bacterium]|nr:hypothetical protein [Planctomycetota bacterium]
MSLVTLLTIAYLIFTILCLNSGGIDYQAGMMLLLNAPILLLWIGLLLRSNSFSTLIVYTTAGVQGLILFGMLIREIGEPSTALLIKRIILVFQGLIVGICHRLHLRANPNPTA